MALGRRKKERQQDFWVATTELPRSEGHVFYQKLNKLLREAGFDEYVETLCEPHYHDTMGRPGIPPGTYFRMLLVGYFEGLQSQRGIAWRCSDSLSGRSFLGLALGVLRAFFFLAGAFFLTACCASCLRGFVLLDFFLTIKATSFHRYKEVQAMHRSIQASGRGHWT